MVRWLRGTPVVSSWQRLRCQPCHQCHALGTRDREELLDSPGSAVSKVNNLPTNPTAIAIAQCAKIKSSKARKGLIPPIKCCIVHAIVEAAVNVGNPSSALPLEIQGFCSLCALPGASLTLHEMADGAGLNASNMRTSGQIGSPSLQGSLWRSFRNGAGRVSCIRSMHLHSEPV